MAFPRLNMASYRSFFLGGIIMLASFFMPGGAAQSGWTSYVPLAIIAPGQTMWLVGMIFLITSSLLGAINFITTTIQLRAKGSRSCDSPSSSGPSSSRPSSCCWPSRRSKPRASCS